MKGDWVNIALTLAPSRREGFRLQYGRYFKIQPHFS
jgi:hypothetical protein